MSLVAQYLFNDNANDECGNFNGTASNVTYENAPVDKGFSGKVAVFNGSSTSYIVAAPSTTMFNGTWTVEFWACPTGKNNESVAMFYTGVVGQNKWMCLQHFSDNKFYLGFYDNDLSTSNTYTSFEWRHLVFQFNSSTRERKIWVNGSLAAQDTASSSPSIASNPFYIAAAYYNGATQKTFEGKMANLRIYDSILSSSEIEQHYQYESSIPSPFQQIATGGDITYIDNGDGTYDEIHTFKTSGTFTFLSPFADEVQALVVGGGGGGISNGGGGGGGGGISYKAKGDGWKLNQLSYQVVVGDGGVGKNTESSGQAIGNKGGDSSFAELVGYGGGAGGLVAGGSAGGANAGGWGPQGTTTPLQGVGTRVYGNTGGILGSGNWGSGGGGGAGGAGSNKENGIGGNGGPGLDFDISGSLKYYGGGGAGADDRSSGTRPSGGIGGGGSGGMKGQSGSNGGANTGGGGGSGGGSQGQAGSGGSGIVIIRFTVKPSKTGAELLSMMI